MPKAKQLDRKATIDRILSKQSWHTSIDAPKLKQADNKTLIECAQFVRVDPVYLAS